MAAVNAEQGQPSDHGSPEASLQPRGEDVWLLCPLNSSGSEAGPSLPSPPPVLAIPPGVGCAQTFYFGWVGVRPRMEVGRPARHSRAKCRILSLSLKAFPRLGHLPRTSGWDPILWDTSGFASYMSLNPLRDPPGTERQGLPLRVWCTGSSRDCGLVEKAERQGRERKRRELRD